MIPTAQRLPQEWLQTHRWHAWKMFDGQKVPINSFGRKADHVAIRCNYDEAAAIAEKHGGGVGYSIDNETDGTDIVFIDLDGCVAESGGPKEWALPIVMKFGRTYSQFSISGTGMHIFCTGRFPGLLRKVGLEGDHHNIQIFDSKRFAAMVGSSSPEPVLEMQEQLNWLAGYLQTLKAEQLALMGSTVPPEVKQATQSIGLRMPGDWDLVRARAAGYLRKIPPAKTGQSGGTRTLETVMKVLTSFDLNQSEAFEVVKEWNQACDPPWTDEDLMRKISEADKIAGQRGTLLSVDSRPQLNSWKEGEPFPEVRMSALGHSQMQPFPFGEMPPPFGEIAIKAAESIRTHPDLLAVSMLAVLGAAIGRSRTVKIRPGWISWPSAWYALVSPIGFGKSPSIGFAERELKRIDAALVAQSQAALDTWVNECECMPKGEAKPPKPPMLRIRMRSGTLPALIESHRQNELGIFYSPDELNSWLSGMGEFSKGGNSDRPNWLSARTGGDLSQDRISGGLRYVPQSAVTIIGGLPPAMLGEFIGGPGDGLVERLMFAYPDHITRPDPPALDSDDTELCPEWDSIVRRMYNFRIGQDGEFLSEPIQLNLAGDKGAAEAFHRIECKMNSLINEDPESALAGFYSKIPYDIASWAMTLALLEVVTSDAWPNINPVILAEHVNAAGAIAEYFLACAAKVLEMGGGLNRSDRRVLRRIARDRTEFIDARWINSTFSGRSRPQAEAIKAMLMRLSEAQVLVGSKDGVYQVNPHTWELRV